MAGREWMLKGQRGPMLSSPNKFSSAVGNGLGGRKPLFLSGETPHLPTPRLPTWPSPQHLELDFVTQFQEGSGIGFRKGKREK